MLAVLGLLTIGTIAIYSATAADRLTRHHEVHLRAEQATSGHVRS